MTQEERALLLLQLREALREGDPMEILTLAGLVARYNPDEPLLERVRALGLDAPALSQVVDTVLLAVAGVNADEDPAETWDVLCQLDELSAGLVVLGDPGAHSLVDEAVHHIAALPEAWSMHADVASEALLRGGIRPGEPAQRLWAAVEASRFEVGEDLRASESARVFVDAGVNPVVKLWDAQDAEPRDPATPIHWESLGAGEDWELALTADPQGAPVLVLAGRAGRFERDGAIVEPTVVEGDQVVPASPGAWVVGIGEHLERFELRR